MGAVETMGKILVIDDSILQIVSLLNLLEQDHTVELCSTGPEGLKRVKEFEPDLILLDIIMPEMDGFEVLRRLKQDEAAKDIPVIMITSLSDADNEEKGFTLGAVDYIIKPFQKSIVKARVQTHTELYAYRRSMENLARLDALTGIANRRSYDERSVQEWNRAIRDKKPISIAVLDIDYFKEYNDLYGHPNGDEVLRKVAQALSGNLRRASDFAARYGGEEFALLMPNTPEEAAVKISENICKSIECFCIPHGSSCISEFLTVSVGGITVVPNMEEDYGDYFGMADRMLYEAKKNGRNKVAWAFSRKLKQ